MASALTALALVGTAELGLRLAGRTPAESTLRYQRVYTPLFRPVELPDGRPVVATLDPRLPFQWVDPTDDDVLRVACFGGSATAGLGCSPSATFAAELEGCLRACVDDREVEVLNLGVVAISSTQVRQLVRDVVAAVPLDAVVVYSGNNEFLELHSERFGELQGTAPSAVATLLSKSALLATVRGNAPEPSVQALEGSITTRALAGNDARVSHSEMMRELHIEQPAIDAVYATYADNLRAIAGAAREAEVPLLLCTVGANWRWTGLEDEPLDWLDEIGEPLDAPDWSRAAAAAAQRADASENPLDVWRWTARAARATECAGGDAVELWRRSLDLDPHLRRATSRHAAIVHEVACDEPGATLVDVAGFLERTSDDGVVGFEAFYDYVHFTPTAALETARLLGEELALLGLIESFSPADDYLHARRAFLQGDGPDALAVGEFVGFGDDRALLESRDLWRYDALADRLDAAIEADPGDWRALAWRGNVHFFRPLGRAQAEADYRASLAIEPHREVSANLRQLLTDRRP